MNTENNTESREYISVNTKVGGTHTTYIDIGIKIQSRTPFNGCVLPL